jgi:hypothetical protein
LRRAVGVFDVEHVELAFDIAEDEIASHGARRATPLRYSITSSARASNGDILRVGLCGLEIISFISSFRRSHHRG